VVPSGGASRISRPHCRMKASRPALSASRGSGFGLTYPNPGLCISLTAPPRVYSTPDRCRMMARTPSVSRGGVSGGAATGEVSRTRVSFPSRSGYAAGSTGAGPVLRNPRTRPRTVSGSR